MQLIGIEYSKCKNSGSSMVARCFVRKGYLFESSFVILNSDTRFGEMVGHVTLSIIVESLCRKRSLFRTWGGLKIDIYTCSSRNVAVQSDRKVRARMLIMAVFPVARFVEWIVLLWIILTVMLHRAYKRARKKEKDEQNRKNSAYEDTK